MSISSNTMYYNLTLSNRINLYKTYLEKSTERLSTGKAINSAADSPSDILRISRMKSQIIGTHAAQRNIQDALSLTQVMENALTQMHDMGLRLKELSVRYNDSGITAEDKGIIEKEATELVKEMKSVMETTEFGGINVFENDQYQFQTGNSATDRFIVENPLSDLEINVGAPASNSTFGVSAISYAAASTEAAVKTYGIAVTLPSGQKLPGEIQLSQRGLEEGKNIDFSINTYNGEASRGKLSFIDDNTASFELHVITQGTQGSNVNIKYTGTLELNGNASRTDLSGEGTFVLDEEFGGWSGKVVFTLKNQGEDPTDPEDPVDDGKVDFEDIDKIPVADLLRGDFVDKNILEPLAISRASVGIEQSILEYKMSRQVSTEEIMTNALSKIEDVDMAKELMNKVKYDLLLQTNLQLLSQNLDDQRSYILDLIKQER